MTGKDDGLLGAVPDARSIEPRAESKYLHLYDAVLDDGERWRLLTVAPDITDSSVRAAFTQVAGQWKKHGSHDNCVTVHATGERPRPWVAVEYLDGEPVTPELTHEEIGRVLEDVADVLQHAGLFYGSFHLALDPEQIWVTRDDDGAVSAVVDNWGLERACRVAAGETPTTPYTPPELLDDPDEKSSSADVYGLGGVIYYALTGQPPVDPEDNLAAAIRAGSITPPSEIDPSLPPELDDALATALATDPEDRYESLPALQRGINNGLTAAIDSEQGDVDDESQPAAVAGDSTTDSDNERAADSEPTDESATDTDGDTVSSDEQHDTAPTPDADDGTGMDPEQEPSEAGTDSGATVDAEHDGEPVTDADDEATPEDSSKTPSSPGSQSDADTISRRSLAAGIGIGALGVGGLLVLGSSILGGDENDNGVEATNGDENDVANGDENGTADGEEDESEPPEPAVTFPDQALDGDEVTIEVTAPDEHFVLISYQADGEAIVAGSDDVSELEGAEFPVELEDRDGLPGEHTAHIIANEDGSSIYGPGMEVSGSTAAAAAAIDRAEITE